MIVEMASVGYGALAMAGWGCGDFIAKKIVGSLGYFRVLLYTQLVGLVPLFFLPVFFAIRLPSSPTAVALTMGTAASSVLALLFFYKALSVGRASIITPVTSASAIVAMVLSFAILGETLSMVQILCLVMALMGILFLSTTMSGSGRLREKGTIYALGCMISAGVNSILIKLLSYHLGNIGTFFFNRLLVVIIVLVVFQLCQKRFGRETGTKVSLKVLVPAGLTEFVGYFGYVVGVGVGLVSIVVPICSASPAVTVVLAQAFLREGLLHIQKVAIVLIILGIVLLPIMSGL